ncbi:hypothetical protein C0584_03650 [Candidatus Parcubacteria bacterium]|nr:MAG: hypothetical protein C0584_03650 [Candidatus Parcubacteria bacterium]
MKNKKGLIIFDLDGTLYSYGEKVFEKSFLGLEVKKNIIDLIKRLEDCDEKKAIKKYSKLKAEFGENFSVAFENRYSIKRLDYFKEVWNINADNYLKASFNLKKLLLDLSANYVLVLLSDAPGVWISSAIKTLGVKNIFTKIYSGETNIRKNNFRAFEVVKTDFPKMKKYISVGDQETTDIIPAKKIGMITVLIAARNNNQNADYEINSVLDLVKIKCF